MTFSYRNKPITPTPMKPITIWQQFNEERQMFEHNHIDDGHLLSNAPIPISQEQKKSWGGVSWKKEFGYLKDGHVVKVDPLKITLTEYGYYCGDGCCYNSGTITTVNGVQLPLHNQDAGTILTQVLEHLGYRVKIEYIEDAEHG